jgi:hypothetical protein
MALVLGLCLAQTSHAERLANHFVCTLHEGKTPQDLVAFKASYEAAVAEAGLDGYELQVLFPLYVGEYGPGRFVWVGSWADFTEMQRISDWFRQSEWPAKFQALMSCENSSLWRVVD